ncbi:hypothetical protein TRFO_06647 [Tritrichomonas foetus]|uniref:Uncharacterized protein n=1 Tax=Tritrichomonas foetus TaxID=1144522 RepID=A0A1J4K0Z6_9EUKA|nr:hypothetical protein TRFO_06647 [Tritrichomonas foetus]|eukprot:OHT03422.1 hypothetical protein TRFO_06647 [Tritrichomonas foetus]
MFNYATELMKRKQYNESIHYFTSLINVPYKIDSGLKVKALYRLGECYFQNKNYLDAETFYNQSIKCYIDQSTKTTKNIEYSHYSYFKLATIYLWEKKTEQVVTCINNCIESNNPQFLVDCVLLLNKVREKSTENLKSEILAKLNSSTTIKENSKAIQGLIQICEKKKMWKKSRKYCKIGIKLKLEEEEEDKNYFKFHLAQSKMEEGKEIMAKLASKGYQNAALFLKS